MDTNKYKVEDDWPTDTLNRVINSYNQWQINGFKLIGRDRLLAEIEWNSLGTKSWSRWSSSYDLGQYNG